VTTSETPVLVLPGYMNSGPGHWQTRWEAAHAGFARVQMPDWMHPDCEAWCATLEAAVQRAPAGAEVAVSAMNSAITTANAFYESIWKTVQQAVEMAEGNADAVTRSTGNTPHAA